MLKPSAARVAYHYLMSRSYTYSMGAWGGVLYNWPPESKDWEVSDYIFDRFKSAYKMTYQWVGRPKVTLFVEFDATKYIRSEGRSPGTFEASAEGQVMKGTWRTLADIPKALQRSIKWADGLLKKLQGEIAKLSDSTWEVSYDGYQIDAYYRGPKSSRFSDAHMDVTFLDVDYALVKGEAQQATISFSEGADYQGSYGDKEIDERYKSLGDIKRILAKAETLYKKWDPPRPDLQ